MQLCCYDFVLHFASVCRLYIFVVGLNAEDLHVSVAVNVANVS